MNGIDVRLAVPVAMGWATLGMLELARPDAAAVLIGLAAASLIALAVCWRLHGARRGLVAMIAVGLAVSALLTARWMHEPAQADEDPGRCEVTLRLDSGNPLPAAVTVLEGDCGGTPQRGRAVLMAPEADDIDPQTLGFGTMLHADCSTWLFDGTWMLDCGGAEVVERPLHAQLSSQWRAAFNVANEPLPGDGGALLAGLAIGDTSRVDEGLQQAMLDAGLSHLTAVSGSNCAIVTASAFALAAALGARRWVRVLTALVAMGAFVVLVTPEPSVTRASLMAVIALFGLLRGQPRSAVPLLALAVLVGLLLHPSLAVSVGFVLSVLATAGLIVHSIPLSEMLTRWMPRPLAIAVAVPAAAQLWCLPALIVLDNGVQPLSVLWNMAAAPAAPIVTVVGLVACLASQVVPVIGTVVAWFAWPAAAWIAAIARLSDTLPEWRIPWAGGAAGAALAAAGILGIGLLMRRRRGGTAVLSIACVVAASLAVVPAQLVRASLGDWWIMQCDVAQGHATLVRFEGTVLLIDTGEHDDKLEHCLELAGVDTVDVLLLTHFDHDHVGAAPSLRGRIDVVAHGPTDESGEELLEHLARAGTRAAEVGRGDTLTAGALRIEVLWPGAGAIPGNEASLVLAVTAPGHPSLLVLGDIGQREQRSLLRDAPAADVLLAAHHCSADQHAPLYTATRPSAVLVGVGENSYGHPTAACLDAISGAGASALRTDKLGSVAIMPDGTVWTEHEP